MLPRKVRTRHNRIKRTTCPVCEEWKKNYARFNGNVFIGYTNQPHTCKEFRPNAHIGSIAMNILDTMSFSQNSGIGGKALSHFH